MTYLPIALFNFQSGGRTAPGQYDFDRLQRAFAGCPEAPALILLCEAKEYGYWGSAGLLAAAEALSGVLGRTYDARLGWMNRGDNGPAIFFDSQVLALRYWGDGHCTVPDDKRNYARFGLRGTNAELAAIVRHWSFRSGAVRRTEAEVDDRYGEESLPTLLGGDLNGTASGFHMPQGAWMDEGYRKRSQKAMRLPNEAWVADTDAVDHLIGRWDPALNDGQGGRLEGCGFRAVAELAYQTGTPADEAFRATVNDGIDAFGGLLIDWLLANRALASSYVRGTYRVHVPISGRAEYPSDHRLVTAAFDL